MRRIGIVVVHGIGEQRRFELLEAIASNLYRALRRDPARREGAYIELHRAGAAERGGSVDSAWRMPPAAVGWRTPEGTPMEVVLREVYWADLDLPDSWRGTFKLWGWALGIAGLRFYTDARVGPAQRHGMCEPAFPPKGWRRIKVRAQLFLAALVFFYLIVSVFLLNWVFFRRLPLFDRFRRLVNSHLGDVKLYQDWYLRDDARLEVIGRKSRVAIRARTIRVLVDTAAQTLSRNRAERLDAYYLVSHSLGTVVAFNGLMETELALPNYLSREEWQALPRRLKRRTRSPAPARQMPVRPPWLTPRDAIDRARLFERLEGFLTLGSPLDKFAALWPCIVRTNAQGLRRGLVPWINVADVQDIVGASIDLLGACPPTNGIGGLAKTEVSWADQWTLASAHTSYWKARRRASHPERLIERLVPWLEGKPLTPPPNRMPVWLARAIYWLSLILLPAVILLGFVTLAWWMADVPPFPPRIAYSAFLATAGLWALAAGIAVVAVFSLGRAIWERVKLGWEV